MKDAFGVERGDEIAKFSMGGVSAGLKAMKFGNATSVPKAMAAGWQRGAKSGGNVLQRAGTSLKYGFKRSPGTVLAAGGLGIGGATALGSRRKQY